jgi:ankyrin repeat protein
MDCFERGLGERSIQEFITTGHYAFAEYAIVYWPEHLITAVRALDSPDLESLAAAIEVFLKVHFSSTPSTQSVPKTIERAIDKFQPYAFYNNLGQSIALMEDQNRSNLKAETAINNLDIKDVLSRIRSLIEKLSSSETTKQSLQSIYGAKLYKCSRFDCTSFFEGFSNLHDCRQHQKRHERRFRCTLEGCVVAQAGYASSAELQRHLQRSHDPSGFPDFPCFKKPDRGDAMLAIKEGNLPVIERYLQVKLRGDPKEKYFDAALKLLWERAIAHPDDEVLNLLISHTPFRGTRAQHFILKKATATRQVDLVRRFVGREFNASDIETQTLNSRGPIIAAISHDDVDILRILVESHFLKTHPHRRKEVQHHLVEACRLSSFSCAQYFVAECGLDPFKHDLRELRAPFCSAVAAGHKSRSDYLLNLRSDHRLPKPETREDLMKYAATSGFEDIVQMFIDHQFATDELMANKYTVQAKLVNAVRHGKEELVTELLPLAGPDYDVPDRNGCSMLIYAALNGLEHAVEYLLEKGADVNRSGNCPEVHDWTPLDQTALLLATFNGHLPIVRRLLQCPDIHLTSGSVFRDGPILHAAMRMAQLKGYTNISRLLEAYMASGATAMPASTSLLNRGWGL